MGQSKLNKRMGGERSQKGLKHLAKKKIIFKCYPRLLSTKEESNYVIFLNLTL